MGIKKITYSLFGLIYSSSGEGLGVGGYGASGCYTLLRVSHPSA